MIRERLRSPMAGNFISLVMLQGINYLLPFLSFPYLARTLGMQQWGVVEFAYAFIQYFVMFTDFGFNLSGTKYIAAHRDRPDLINRYLNSACLARLLLGSTALLLFSVIVFAFDRFRPDAGFYLLYFGVVVGNVMFPLWFFQGTENMKYITAFSLIAKSISLLPLFLLVKSADDYLYVPLCYSAGYIAAGGFSMYNIYVKSGYRWYLPAFRYVRESLKDSATYFLSTASMSLYVHSNAFILGLACGPLAVGHYAAAQRLYQAYDQMAAPVTGVLFPHMSKTKDAAFFKKIFIRLVVANVVLVVAALLLSEWIIALVFGPGLDESLAAFRILLVANLFSIPSMLVGYPFLAAMGHPKYTNLTGMLIALFHLSVLTALYFTGQISVLSVCIAVVCSHCILLAMRLNGIRRFRLFNDSSN